MADLIIVAYPDEHRAAEVMAALTRMQVEHLIDLEDAAYVVRNAQGKVKVHQAVSLTAAGATGGLLWGTLIGLLFLNPLLGGVVGAAAGALGGKLSDYGINDDFIKELAASLQPGSSAIFVLVRRVTADKVIPEFSKFGGKILRSSLSIAEEQKLQAALEGKGGAA